MAFILNNMGYKVIINDFTNNKELADIISHNDFSNPIRTYRNIDFNFSKSYLDGYDFSITYISEINDTVFNTQNSFLIINSAAYKKDICLCEELIRLLDIDTIFILRDKLGSIGKKYIERFMISSNRILCMHEVEFDEYDKKYQYSMDYDGVVDFKYISDDLCRVLIKSISVISGKSQTIVRKALKWAKGGKVFDNRFLE